MNDPRGESDPVKIHGIDIRGFACETSRIWPRNEGETGSRVSISLSLSPPKQERETRGRERIRWPGRTIFENYFQRG